MQHVKSALESIVFDIINPLPNEYIGLARVPSTEGCIEFVKLQPGSYQPHIHDTIDAHLTVLTGTGRIILNGEAKNFAPNSTFEVPQGTSHGFEIIEPTVLLSIQDRPNTRHGKQ